MSRTLAPVDASDPLAVSAALRDALTADGPAVFPVAAGARPPADLPATVPQRIALVVETSGSSGRPKRVALTADAVLASAAASDTALGGPGQWLLALPAHYIAGVNVLARSITAQTEPVVLRPGHFDAEAFVDAARTLDGDRRYASLVPVQLSRLVDLAETDAPARDILRRFDRLLVGGQATPLGLRERAATLGVRVTRTYGSSETSGGCVYDGVPIGTVVVEVIDGEVQLAGPMLAEEYLDDPERTAASFVTRDSARRYRTGDGGEVVDGVLSVSGRRDRVLISGGEKVSLDAVESVVHALPGHSDAVAVAVDDPEWGQSVAVITTAGAGAMGTAAAADMRSGPAASGGQAATRGGGAGRTDQPRGADGEVSSGARPDAVADALVATLGRAARPRRILVVRDMPLLPSGKPDRAACAALL